MIFDLWFLNFDIVQDLEFPLLPFNHPPVALEIASADFVSLAMTEESVIASEAWQSRAPRRDCFVATLLATTKEEGSSQRQRKKTPRNDKGRRLLAMTKEENASQ
ncbi:MAG: hypothetical protein WBE46_09110 [Dehalococcoidia bacterium]